MKRSKWKGPYIEKKMLEKKTILSRNSELVLNFQNQLFWVHNGKSLVKLVASADMSGHKAGEFVPTRARFKFKKKKKKKK